MTQLPQNMQFETPITIRQLVTWVRLHTDFTRPWDSPPFCVYGRGDSSDAVLDSTCYVSSGPEVTDEFDEIYPAFVVDNGLELWYRDEIVQDVIANALHQKEAVSDEVILKALKHYNERDSFLDLSQRHERPTER